MFRAPTPRQLFAAGLTALTLALTAVSSAWASAEVYQKTVTSCVWVISPRDKGASTGTGVLVDAANGLIVTNYHVVREQPKAMVFFPLYQDGKLLTDPNVYVANAERFAKEGQVLVKDPARDLAVIKVADVPKGVPALPLAAASASPGETVHSVGNSGVKERKDGSLDGALWRYSKGDVRSVYAQKAGDARFWVVETQVPSNHGDSGGPVVNDKGQLVSVTTRGDLDQSLVTSGADVREVKNVLDRAKGGSTPAADARARQALDKAGLKYKVLDNGDFELGYAMADKGTHTVYVGSQTRRQDGKDVRDVWSVALVYSGRQPEDLPFAMLKLNASTSTGSCKVITLDDGTSVVAFVATLPANAAPAALKETAEVVVTAAYDLRKQFGQANGGAEAPKKAAPRVEGVWQSLSKDKDGNDTWLALALNADGTYVLGGGDQTGLKKEFKGTYAYGNGVLTLTERSGEVLEGTVTWVNNDAFVLTLKTGAEVRFDRYKK